MASRPVTAAAGPLRPALLVNHLKGGGKERFVVDLANALGALGQQPLVVCFERGGALAAHLDRSRVRVVELGKRRGNSVRVVWALARHLRAHRSRVVHSNNWGTLVESLCAARLAGGIPVLHTQHGLDFERAAARSGSSIRMLAKRVAAARLGRLVTVSEEVRAMVVDEWRVPRDGVQVIANGVVVPPVVEFSAAERAQRRAALGLPSGAFVIGTVGFLRPVKDYPSLVRAFRLVADRRPDAHLVIAGDGPSRQDIEDAAAEAGVRDTVHVLGARRDVPELLPLFDAFAMSSLSEGISLAILEAMSYALPVVVTRVGGNPQIVEHERSGLLVEARDVSGMAEALLRLADAPECRRALGSRARQRVVDVFSIERMAREYLDAYADVCR